MTIPVLEPVVFIGSDLIEGESGLYFQDADSYFAGERWESGKNESDSGIDLEKHNQKPLYDFEHALDVLLAFSLPAGI